MGDDIGLGSATDCLLSSFSDLKRQTELYFVGIAKNNNKRNPNRCHHPLITQLISITAFLYLISKIDKMLKKKLPIQKRIKICKKKNVVKLHYSAQKLLLRVSSLKPQALYCFLFWFTILCEFKVYCLDCK